MTEKIQLSKEQVEIFYKLKDKPLQQEWLASQFPEYTIKQVIEVGATLMTTAVDEYLEHVITLIAERKSDDQILGDQLLVFIRTLSPAPTDLLELRASRLAQGVCPDCGAKTKDWKPMFGGLAPEWWGTLRERGIDPATGHKLNCPSKHK